MKILTEIEFGAALERIRELWDCPIDSPEAYELDSLAHAVVAYEDEHYPIGLPSEDGSWEYFMESRGIGMLVDGKWVWKARQNEV